MRPAQRCQWQVHVPGNRRGARQFAHLWIKCSAYRTGLLQVSHDASTLCFACAVNLCGCCEFWAAAAAERCFNAVGRSARPSLSRLGFLCSAFPKCHSGTARNVLPESRGCKAQRSGSSFRAAQHAVDVFPYTGAGWPLGLHRTKNYDKAVAVLEKAIAADDRLARQVWPVGSHTRDRARGWRTHSHGA